MLITLFQDKRKNFLCNRRGGWILSEIVFSICIFSIFIVGFMFLLVFIEQERLRSHKALESIKKMRKEAFVLLELTLGIVLTTLVVLLISQLFFLTISVNRRINNDRQLISRELVLDLVIHDCMRADFIINNDKQAVILIQRFLNEAGERCEQGCSWSSVGDTIIRRIYSIDKDSNTERYREKQRSSFFSADLRLEGLSSVYRQNKTVFLLKYQIKDSFFEKIIPSYCALIKSY